MNRRLICNLLAVCRFEKFFYLLLLMIFLGKIYHFCMTQPKSRALNGVEVWIVGSKKFLRARRPDCGEFDLVEQSLELMFVPFIIFG